jgi:hypothetical protein
MLEDSFEKARNAFFKTAGTAPKVSAPPIECFKLQDATAAEEPLETFPEAPTRDLR